MILAATDDLLGVLKYVLLALLYLFFARVMWAVWSEVRATKGAAGAQPGMPPPPGTPLIPPVPAKRPSRFARNVRNTTQDPTGGAPMPAPGIDVRAPRRSRGTGGPAGSLIVVEPKARKGFTYRVMSEMTLGRNDTCSIPLPDDTFASGLHARVYLESGTIWVDDLGSTNGTFLNGERLTGATALEVGDTVQIGATVFEAR